MDDSNRAMPSARAAGAAHPSPQAVSAQGSIPIADKLAYTLEWCADQQRIEGLHPVEVRKAAALLREQAARIAELERTIAANTPEIHYEEKSGPTPYRRTRRFQFIAAMPQAYYVETDFDVIAGYPPEVEARRAVSMFVRQFEERLLALAAQAIETRSDETARPVRSEG